MESTPEKSASAGSGIVRYASGIHPWKGNDGILIRKASANAANIQRCVPSLIGCSASAWIENDVVPSGPAPVIIAVATAAASMSSEPTSV